MRASPNNKQLNNLSVTGSYDIVYKKNNVFNTKGRFHFTFCVIILFCLTLL